MLGIVWLRGPCTIYVAMRELASSESSFHRSRAGTAYSIAKRLVRFGMLEQADDPAALVRITPLGKSALHAWLAPPVPMADVAHTADLLRLRFFFLGALSPADRIAFIEEAIMSLEELEATATGLIVKNEEIGEYFGALATISVVLESRARIQWLQLAREWVNLEPGAGYSARLIEALTAEK